MNRSEVNGLQEEFENFGEFLAGEFIVGVYVASAEHFVGFVHGAVHVCLDFLEELVEDILDFIPVQEATVVLIIRVEQLVPHLNDLLSAAHLDWIDLIKYITFFEWRT